MQVVVVVLGHQPSSKLASLASLQLTPTLSETKRKLIHSLKSTRTASIASESTSTLNGNHLLRQQTCSSINPHQIYSAMMSNQMTTSSLLSLDTCIEDKIMPPPPPMQQHHHHHHLVENKPIGGGKVIKKTMIDLILRRISNWIVSVCLISRWKNRRQRTNTIESDACPISPT